MAACQDRHLREPSPPVRRASVPLPVLGRVDTWTQRRPRATACKGQSSHVTEALVSPLLFDAVDDSGVQREGPSMASQEA